MAEEPEKAGARAAGRGLLFIVFAKVWFIVTAYAIHFVLPRLLGSPEAFGLYSTAISTVSIVNNVLIASTVQTLSKLVSEDEARAGTTLRQGLRIQLVVGLVVSGALFAGSGLLAEGLLKDPELTPLLRVSAAVVLSYALYAALVGYLNGRQRFFSQARLDATFSTLRTIGILGGAALGIGVIGAVTGFACAAVAILLIAGVSVGTGEAGPGLPLERWTSFMRPIWIYQAFLNGILLIDVLVMKGTLSSMATDAGAAARDAATTANEYVGFYSAAQKFAFVPYQLMLSLTFIIFPMISRATSAGDDAASQRTMRGAIRFSLIALTAVAAPVAGAASGVLRIAYPEEYVAGSEALSILVLGAAAFALFVISATALSGSGRPGLAATIGGLGLALVILGNRVLLSLAGIGEHTLAAAATGTSMGMALAAAAAGYAVFRRFGVFVAPLSALRIALAGAAAWLVAHYVPHETRLTALAALVAGGLAFLAVLAALRELGAGDVALVRNVIGRRRD